MYLSDVDRYDLNQNTWKKVADMREARMLPCGAVVHGNIERRQKLNSPHAFLQVIPSMSIDANKISPRHLRNSGNHSHPLLKRTMF